MDIHPFLKLSDFDLQDGHPVIPEIINNIFTVSWIFSPEINDQDILVLIRFHAWMLSIRQQYPLLNPGVTSDFSRWALEPVDKNQHMPLPRAAEAMLLLRPDHAEIFDQSTQEERLRYLTWLALNPNQALRALGYPAWAVGMLSLPGTWPELPRALEGLWRLRPDLQNTFPLADASHRWAFGVWFLLDGASELPQVPAPAWLTERLSLPGTWPELPRALEGLWRLRPDLQNTFPLETPSDALAFLGWFVLSGRSELPWFSLPAWLLHRLGKPSIFDQGEGLCLAMEILWRAWPHLQTEFPLEQGRLQRLRFVALFLDMEPNPLRCGLAPWQLALWAQPSLQVPQSRQDGISLYIEALNTILPPAEQADLRTAAGRFTALKRYLSNLPAASEAVQLSGWMVPAAQKVVASDPELFGADLRLRLAQRATNGVQLLGFVSGRLGIGEDLRTYSEVLDQAGVTHSILDAAPWLLTNWDTFTPPQLAQLATKPCYAITIVCLAAQDCYRGLLNAGPDLRAGRHTIGVWPWELPRWPREAAFVFDMVDEVWAPSRFVAQAFDLGIKPVLHVPLAVTVPQEGGDLRTTLGIAPHTYVFLTAFDSNASYVRKNPAAVVRAFCRAFGPRDDVLLLVKTIYGTSHCTEWEALRRENTLGNQVRFLDVSYNRLDMIRLLRTCDAFISLHRAEGFGRHIAEAMLLGRPVIVSGYSGNMDFTTSETAFLVQGRLRPVIRGQYLFHEGQEWFEADEDHAVELLRYCRQNPEVAERVARTGRDFVERNHSPSALAPRLLRLLRDRGLSPESGV